MLPVSLEFDDINGDDVGELCLGGGRVRLQSKDDGLSIAGGCIALTFTPFPRFRRNQPCTSARRFLPSSCTLVIGVAEYGHNANSGLERRAFVEESQLVRGVSGEKCLRRFMEGLSFETRRWEVHRII